MFWNKHLAESGWTYYQHFRHGYSLGLVLWLCSLLTVIDIIFSNAYCSKRVDKTIVNVYAGLMRRWFDEWGVSANDKNLFGKEVEKLEKRNYIKQIQEGIIKPFGKSRLAWELFITGASSMIHCLMPNFLPYHAARSTIRIYHNTRIKRNNNERST